MAGDAAFNALLNYQPTPAPFDPATDPLGIGLQTRGMQARQAYNIAHPVDALYGPLPDPQWEGWKQATAEAGVGGFRAGASPEGSNQLTGFSQQRPDTLPSTLFQAGQQSALQQPGVAPHQQTRQQQALKGLLGQ